jgi:hypothetical protein
MSDLDISNLPGFSFDPFRGDTLIALEDPFIGSLQQTTRMRCFCKILVAGQDVTDKMEPHLISIRVLQGAVSNTMEIELDDRDASLPLPPLGTAGQVVAAIGWESESMVAIFEGFINDIEHGFGRQQGGRRLWIHCTSAPLHKPGLRTPIQDHMGEGAPPGKKEGPLKGLPDWIQQLAKSAGVTAKVNPIFDKFKSDYWDIANASVYHHVSTLADKFGLWHQFTGKNELLIETIGQRGITCHATWHDNLISYRVRPFVMRTAAGGSKQEWFDAKKSHWNFAEQLFGFTGLFSNAEGKEKQPTPAATETGANQQNEGAQAGSEVKYSSGRIVINGEPRAQPNSYVILTGARQGVDGLYYIEQIEHIYSRQGFLTTLDVKSWASAPADQSVSRGWLPKSALGTSTGTAPGTAGTGPSAEEAGLGGVQPGIVATDQTSNATVEILGDELEIVTDPVPVDPPSR